MASEHAVDVASEVAAARAAWPGWQSVALRERLRVVRRARHAMAERAEELVAAVETARVRGPGETLGAEVLPTADACRFLERRARRILAPRRLRAGFSLLWTGGIAIEIRRDPFGVVLIIGPSNYPLLLPGVQAVQALAAGNAVVIKPSVGGRPAAEAFASILHGAGLDPRLCRVLPETVSAAREAIAAGVDKVVLTGSAPSGQAVLADLAPRLVPATMELSGCDAVFIQADADLDLVVSALTFGMRLNDGRTCIGPHRVLVHASLATDLEERLAPLAAGLELCDPDPAATKLARTLAREAVAAGARLVAGSLDDAQPYRPIVLADASPAMRLLQEDLFAPVLALVSVESDEAALAANAACPYALGATVFGAKAAATALARRIPAGCVVVNDMVAPTADPRLPFGGRGRSGFGVTRGAEGLLEMTTLKAIAIPRGWWRMHFDDPHPLNGPLLAACVAAAHAGSIRARLKATLDLLRTARALRKARRSR